MRILIHGINFAPELVGTGKYTGEMAEWLATRGHDVRVVTAPPYFPTYRVAPEYSSWRYSRETYAPQGTEDSDAEESAMGLLARPGRLAMVYESADDEGGMTEDAPGVLTAAPVCTPTAPIFDGLAIYRCPLWLPHEPSAAKRLLHLASFALSSCPIMLRHVAWKPDVILGIEPTLFCVPAVWLTARLSSSRTWLHVQDFEADAGFEMGLLVSPFLRSVVGWLEQKCLAGFDRVSTISEKMLSKLAGKGVTLERRLLFRNWVDTTVIFPLRQDSPLRAEWGIPPCDIVALYSGSMGQKQGLNLLAEAAQTLAPRQNLRLIFCGEGPGKASLAGLAQRLPNVQLFSIQPMERLNDLLNLADIHLLPQRADAADLVMPSKLTGILASGRPVVATADRETQLAQVVEGRGLVVPSNDAGALAAAIGQLADSPGLRETLGRSARAYAVAHLDKEKVLSDFERELLICVHGKPRDRRPSAARS